MAGAVADLAIRYDRGRLQAPTRTDEGYLVTEARIAAPGIYTYRNPDGTPRRELVTAETIRESIGSILNKPVTIEHVGMLDTSNTQRLSVGSVGERWRIDADGAAWVSLTVRDERGLRALDQGLRECSPGYLIEMDWTPGEDPKYGRYDAVQVRRRYNHLAMTDGARGEGAFIRTDSQTGDPMNPLLTLLVALGVSEAAAKAAEAQIKSAAGETVRLDSASVEAAEKARDAEKARADKAEERLTACGIDPAVADALFEVARFDSLMAWHSDRSDLESKGAGFGLKADDMRKLSDLDLRKAILGKAKPDLRLDSLSADRIAGAVDTLADKPTRTGPTHSPFSVDGASGPRPAATGAPAAAIREDAAPAVRSGRAALKSYNDARAKRLGA